VLLGLGQTPMTWKIASFLTSFLFPISYACSQSIWQSKTDPDAQGRVFAARRIIVDAMVPVAMAVAGPLADSVVEPALAPGGSWIPYLSWLVGQGPGAGMSLIFLVVGLLSAALAGSAYQFRAIREIDERLPDTGGSAGAGPAAPARIGLP
jgi:hypothetical protein